MLGETVRVKILGAGSIGNHLAHACRGLDWSVTVCDTDPAALERTREEIYPGRYGAWDSAIGLAMAADVAAEPFDVVIVGTPPDTHMGLALAELESPAPRVLLIEKPLCTPALENCACLAARAAEAGTRVLVGYNHCLTPNTRIAEQWLASGALGEVLTLDGSVREHWRGVFAAHPWLAGPHDTYLGFTDRGGGALCEHSHGVNIWQHFARASGHGRVVSVSALLDTVEAQGARYDRIAQLDLVTESGLVGRVVQDVITDPPVKRLRVQGTSGHIDWEVNAEPGADAVTLWTNGQGERRELLPKTRPDDFRPEIEHVAAILADPALPSAISLEAGLDTMLVIAAAVRSHAEGRQVTIDEAWRQGWQGSGAVLGSQAHV
jgi:predicted dehydrogenase